MVSAGASQGINVVERRESLVQDEAATCPDRGEERFERPVLPIQDFTVAIHLAAVKKETEVTAEAKAKAKAKTQPEIAPDNDRVESRYALRSYEWDMLSYAYRNNPPFNTATMTLPDNVRVEIGFPEETSYHSEQKDWISVCPVDRPKPLRRTVRLKVAFTEFADASLFILHLMFYPFLELIDSDTPSEYRLDEYDLIKLIKLWEGGEGQPDPGSEEEESETIKEKIPHFFIGNVGPLSLDRLIDKLFKGKFELCTHPVKSAAIVPTSSPSTSPSGTMPGRDPHVGTRVGTVEVVLSPDNAAQGGDVPQDTNASPAGAKDGDDEQAHWFFDELRSIKDDRSAFEKKWRCPDPEDKRWRQLVAVGGLVQGLLDFDRIDTNELTDVFEGFAEDRRCIYVNGLSITGFHKGTLLKISAGTIDAGVKHESGSDSLTSDSDDRTSPVRLDPYLLVPQAVLLHNDELLRRSGQCSDDLAGIRGKTWRDRLHDRDLRINKTQELVNDQRKLLSQLSLNVFNYVSERTLFSAGQDIRGFDDRTREMHQRLSEDSQQMEARLKRRDTYGTVSAIVFAVTGAFVGIIGHLQLGSVVGDVITAVTLVGIFALAGVFLIVRRLS
jgi:hypothetical protein